jgi:hypothetical protein
MRQCSVRSTKRRVERRVQIRRIALFAQLATCVGAIAVPFGLAEDDHIHQALKLLTDTANEICLAVPLEQTRTGVDLSGDA